MTSNEPPVVIVGGGLGGLAAALALAQAGRSCHLLEKASEFREVGAGIQLGPNVFRAFDRLGLTDAVCREAWFPDALVMKDALSAEEVARVPLGEAFLQRFGRPYAVSHRADLHQVLLAACRANRSIRLETSQNVVGLLADGDRVTVQTKSGLSLKAAAVIGADGLWSEIRRHVVDDGPPRVSGHIAYRAVLAASDVPAELFSPSMTLWAGPKMHLVHYPLRRGELYNLVAVFHSNRYEEGWDSYGDPQELHERFAAARPEVNTLLRKIDTWRMWVLCDREPIKEWTRGRVTLLGDAAHPMLQYLAQGACMAMEDAVCLADQVTAHGDDYARAFLAYQSARYLRTARVQLTARFYGELYHASEATRDLRNHLLRERSPEQSYDGLAWLYDGP